MNAIAAGRLGGLAGGPARARALSPKRRSEIASKASRDRWAPREVPAFNTQSRPERRAVAVMLAKTISADADVVEQVLLMRSLPQWERLARGIARSKLGKVVTP